MVLHEPEIPNNTGNIGRTCVALDSALHLIHPLGFDLSEKACRRAGLDYWPRLARHEHDSFDAYARHTPDARRWLFTARAQRCLFDADFRPGDHLVFGRESTGLPAEITGASPAERLLALPMAPDERSLNLATAVCAALYEAIRQVARAGLIRFEPTPRGVVLRRTL